MRSLAFILIILMIWTVGLIAFASRVARSTPAEEPQPAEGVVALTGPSAARISAAMKLLEEGKATRLLVSGVNRKTSRADVQALAKAPKRLYDCCVDLGWSAVDTIGNARETAAWARAYRFRRLIVVTADYHMPRSVLELKGALPNARVQAYPVATDELDARRWWRSGSGARRMIVEYCKYLVILTREAILSLGPREKAPAATPPPTTVIQPAAKALSRP